VWIASICISLAALAKWDCHNLPQPVAAPIQTELKWLRKGHVGAQFWSVYVDYNLPEPEAVRQTIEQIDTVKRLVARYPGQSHFKIERGA